MNPSVEAARTGVPAHALRPSRSVSEHLVGPIPAAPWMAGLLRPGVLRGAVGSKRLSRPFTPPANNSACSRAHHLVSPAMDPTITAAIIGEGALVVSGGSTALVAIMTSRNAAKTNQATIDAAAANTARALDAAREDRIWDKRAETYVDGMRHLKHQQAIREDKTWMIPMTRRPSCRSENGSTASGCPTGWRSKCAFSPALPSGSWTRCGRQEKPATRSRRRSRTVRGSAARRGRADPTCSTTADPVKEPRSHDTRSCPAERTRAQAPGRGRVRRGASGGISTVRTRSGPRTMAALRNLAVGALHQAGRHGTTEATRWASRYIDRPFTILGLTSITTAVGPISIVRGLTQSPEVDSNDKNSNDKNGHPRGRPCWTLDLYDLGFP